MATHRKSNARIAATIGFSIFAVYLLFVTVLIAREPAPGADSPQELADALVAGLNSADGAGVEQLFADDALADGKAYVSELVTEIDGGGALRAEVVRQGDSSVIVLRQGGRAGCVSWGLLSQGDRVALSGVPPFSAC